MNYYYNSQIIEIFIYFDFISSKVVKSNIGFFLMILATFGSFYVPSPIMFPVFLLLGGLATAIKYKSQPREEMEPIKIKWGNFFLWAGVLVAAAVAGGITAYKPVLIFENFLFST